MSRAIFKNLCPPSVGVRPLFSRLKMATPYFRSVSAKILLSLGWDRYRTLAAAVTDPRWAISSRYRRFCMFTDFPSFLDIPLGNTVCLFYDSSSLFFSCFTHILPVYLCKVSIFPSAHALPWDRAPLFGYLPFVRPSFIISIAGSKILFFCWFKFVEPLIFKSFPLAALPVSAGFFDYNISAAGMQNAPLPRLSSGEITLERMKDHDL